MRDMITTMHEIQYDHAPAHLRIARRRASEAVDLGILRKMDMV